MTNYVKKLLIAMLFIVFTVTYGNAAPSFAATKQLAEQGNAKAQSDLGAMYYLGLGVEASNEESVKWFRKSAEQGYAEAQYHLGEMYLDGEGIEQSYTEALKWLRKSAEQGNTDSQMRLGIMYSLAKGVEKDKVMAYAWFNLAKNNGAKPAVKLMQMTEKDMTAEQIEKAKTINPLTSP